MVPAAVCASFAFMLPIAGPSNAIVFSTGRITITDMVRIKFFIVIQYEPFVIISSMKLFNFSDESWIWNEHHWNNCCYD